MRDVQTIFPRGKVVRDRYVVEELLGKGGFGAVYRVRDRRVKGNVFALKELIDPDKQQRENFAFECEILKRLDHPSLPHVYHVFEDSRQNRVYMLMDFIDGVNLEKLRRRQPDKRFSFAQAMALMEPVIDAVSFVHKQEPPVIHRDIKPSNIIIPASGDGAILIDFGIAKEYDKDATTMAVRHCSPGYGAPEQYARDTDTRTDIYALGATFYTLLTGEVPVDALLRLTQLSGNYPDPLELPHERVATIPIAVSEAIQKAMAVNGKNRFATVEEFWQVLKDALAAEPGDQGEHVSVGSIVEQFMHEDLPISEGVQTPALEYIKSTPATVVEKVLPLARSGSSRRRVVLASLVALLVIIVVAMMAFSIRSPWGPAGSAHSQPTIPVRATPVKHTPTKIATPKPSATMAPTYPDLAGRYDGNITNTMTTPAITTGMSLMQLQRHNADITGYFSVGPGLIGDGNFTGTVTTDKKIQFLVASIGGRFQLFFQGQIMQDGSMSGSYCTYLNSQCNYTAGGYGTWKAFAP